MLTASRSPTLPESAPEDLINLLDDFWSMAVARAELEQTQTMLIQALGQQFNAVRNEQIKNHAETRLYERERATDAEYRLLHEVDQLRQNVKIPETD